jgi:hypothetical protein
MWTWNGSAHEGLTRRAARYLDSYVPLSGAGPVELSISATGGLVALPASPFLRPGDVGIGSASRLRLRRVVSGMRRAARSGGVFHLWWHPENFGADLTGNLAQLDVILDAFAELREREGMRSATMAALATDTLAGETA